MNINMVANRLTVIVGYFLLAGAFQICCLVVVYFLNNKTWSFGLSYYILLGSVLPTWIMAISTLVVTCRIS